MNNLRPACMSVEYACFRIQVPCPDLSVDNERAALLELQREHPEFHFLPYIQFGWVGMSFIVENAALLGAR